MADSKISDLSAVTDVIGTDEYVLARSGASKKIDAADLLVAGNVSFTPAGTISATDVQAAIEEVATEATGGLFNAYAYIRDEQTAGTVGGAATTGSWQTRVLNTEVSDAQSIVSISSNQFTLGAGTYLIQAKAPFYTTQRSQLKVRNVTDSTDALIGGAMYTPAPDSTVTKCFVSGVITIAGSKAFALQYQCQGNNGGDTKGLGVEGNFGVVEVYAEVEIWRFS